MTPQETIIQSGLALRDILSRNPDALSVTIEDPDGIWTCQRDKGLTLCTSSGRRLDIPEAVFEAAELEAWEVAPGVGVDAHV